MKDNLSAEVLITMVAQALSLKQGQFAIRRALETSFGLSRRQAKVYYKAGQRQLNQIIAQRGAKTQSSDA